MICSCLMTTEKKHWNMNWSVMSKNEALWGHFLVSQQKNTTETLMTISWSCLFFCLLTVGVWALPMTCVSLSLQLCNQRLKLIRGGCYGEQERQSGKQGSRPSVACLMLQQVTNATICTVLQPCRPWVKRMGTNFTQLFKAIFWVQNSLLAAQQKSCVLNHPKS